MCTRSKAQIIRTLLNVHYLSQEIVKAINCSLSRFASCAQKKLFENQGWFNKNFKTFKKLTGKSHRANKNFKINPPELNKGKYNRTKIEVAKAISNPQKNNSL